MKFWEMIQLMENSELEDEIEFLLRSGMEIDEIDYELGQRGFPGVSYEDVVDIANRIPWHKTSNLGYHGFGKEKEFNQSITGIDRPIKNARDVYGALLNVDYSDEDMKKVHQIMADEKRNKYLSLQDIEPDREEDQEYQYFTDLLQGQSKGK